MTDPLRIIQWTALALIWSLKNERWETRRQKKTIFFQDSAAQPGVAIRRKMNKETNKTDIKILPVVLPIPTSSPRQGDQYR